jgi:hypothetical protein
MNLNLTQITAIERNEDTFQIVLRDGSQSRIEQTRFRQRGPRKYRTELVVRAIYKTSVVSREQAQAIINKLHGTGRMELVRKDGKNWVIQVWP